MSTMKPMVALRSGVNKKIMVAAKDAGGCQALLPVLKILRNFNYQIYCYAEDPARDIFEESKFDVCEYGRDIKNIKQEILTVKPKVIFVSNSYGRSIEDIFVETGRELNIKTIGILDHWLLYDEKFNKGGDIWYFLPDKLIVMDEFAKKEMVDLGASPDRLIPLGQPTFDFLLGRKNSFTYDEYLKVRKELNTRSIFVLFLSQDMERFYGGPGKRDHLGYTEYIVLEKIIEELRILNKKHNTEISLVVKLHPREEEGKFAEYSNKYKHFTEIKNYDPYKLMFASDLIIGMDTILLVQACVIGLTNISFQPGLSKTDTLITNKLDMGIFSYSKKDGMEKIEKLLFDKEFKERARKKMKKFNMLPDASNRVAKFIMESINEKI